MAYKKTILFIGFSIAVIFVGTILWMRYGHEIAATPRIVSTDENTLATSTQATSTAPTIPASTLPDTSALPDITIVSTKLSIPWDIAFLPDGNFLITERKGNLIELTPEGKKITIKLPHAVPKGEGGLLGIVLHPKFAENKFLYLYMSTSENTTSTKNAVFRYTFQSGELSNEKIIIKDIPGALYHDGGRLAFGPDGYLYITTGDAQTSEIAQNLTSLGGKILRLTDEGAIPTDNPFGTAVYSYGHRNPQGLAWDAAGRLWETEHGRSGITTGLDELNLIVKAHNYGWPTIEGDATKEGMTSPVLQSGSAVTWAPASALYYQGSIFFGALKGEALYQAVLDGDTVKELKRFFFKKYGRIRTVRLGPDGMFYITTSNTDGRGSPIATDDRLIRINPRVFK